MSWWGSATQRRLSRAERQEQVRAAEEEALKEHYTELYRRKAIERQQYVAPPSLAERARAQRAAAAASGAPGQGPFNAPLPPVPASWSADVVQPAPAGQPAPAPGRGPGSGPAPALTRTERARQWATVRSQFRNDLVRMSSYETNPALAIDFPAFNDVTVPEVSAMTKALRTATNLQDATDQKADVGGSDALLAQFRDAVQDFGVAVDTAERAARRLRWSHLPTADREDLDQIRNLLNHAENPGNTDEARGTYYAKLQRVIRKLNDRHGADVVPTGALAAIEAQAPGQVEA